MAAVSHCRGGVRFYYCGRRIYYRPVTAAIYAPAHSQLHRDLPDDATSLMIVALVGMGRIATAVMQGATLPMPFTLWFVLSVVTGMFIGRRLSHHFPEHIVQKGLPGN